MIVKTNRAILLKNKVVGRNTHIVITNKNDEEVGSLLRLGFVSFVSNANTLKGLKKDDK